MLPLTHRKAGLALLPVEQNPTTATVTGQIRSCHQSQSVLLLKPVHFQLKTYPPIKTMIKAATATPSNTLQRNRRFVTCRSLSPDGKGAKSDKMPAPFLSSLPSYTCCVGGDCNIIGSCSSCCCCISCSSKADASSSFTPYT